MVARYKSKEARVQEFHEAMSVYGTTMETMLESRMRLLSEEFNEVKSDMAAMALCYLNGTEPSRERQAALLKELCDLQYVLSGTVDQLGWGAIFDPAFNRVHASNMSKLDDNGDPVKDEITGKVLKGPNYKEAHLIDLIEHLGDTL